MALNGGPQRRPRYRFTEAISLFVQCAPSGQGRSPLLVADPDPEVAGRATRAMPGMGKIEMACLEAARAG